MNLQKWNRIEGAFALNAASMNLPLKIADRFRLSPPLSVSERWFGQTGGRRGCQDFGIKIRQMEQNSLIAWRFHTISGDEIHLRGMFSITCEKSKTGRQLQTFTTDNSI